MILCLHIFNGEAREYYKLEKLWGDGKGVELDSGDIESVDHEIEEILKA